jgi:hypothetical protein
MSPYQATTTRTGRRRATAAAAKNQVPFGMDTSENMGLSKENLGTVFYQCRATRRSTYSRAVTLGVEKKVVVTPIRPFTVGGGGTKR